MKKILINLALYCTGFCLTESSMAMFNKSKAIKRQQMLQDKVAKEEKKFQDQLSKMNPQEQAFLLVSRQRLSTLKELIDSGTIDVNATNEYGQTLMEVVLQLMDQQFSRLGNARPESIQILTFLLERGAGIYRADKQLLTSHMGTVADICISDSNLSAEKICNLLKKQGLDIFRSPCCTDGANVLLSAILNSRSDVVKYLLDQITASGGNINDLFGVKDSNGDGVLHYACLVNDIDTVKLALNQAGANIDDTNNLGRTPLLIAVEEGYFGLVELLIRQKADVTIADKDKNTPLHAAVKTGQPKLVSLILASPNVDKNAKNNSGNTPLHEACYRGNDKVLELLLSNGKVDVNVPNKAKNTPLHIACYKNNLSAERSLLARNDIGIDLVNSEGLTAFFVAFDIYCEALFSKINGQYYGIMPKKPYGEIDFGILEPFRDAEKLPPQSDVEKFMANRRKLYTEKYLRALHWWTEKEFGRMAGPFVFMFLPSCEEFINSYEESRERIFELSRQRGCWEYINNSKLVSMEEINKKCDKQFEYILNALYEK